jgi:integrase
VTLGVQDSWLLWERRTGRDGSCHTERASFLAFCDQYRLPPTPDAVALYLVNLHDVRPRTIAALRYRLRLLDLAAALAGEQPPSRDASLRLFLRGLHRTLTSDTERNRTPLYLEDVDALLHAVDRDRTHQVRDSAFVLLADACALPMEVLRQLQWHQVRFRRNELTLTLPQQKWARGPRGRVVVAARPGPTCPFKAMRAWSRHVGPANGYVFATRKGRPPGMKRAAELLAPLGYRAHPAGHRSSFTAQDVLLEYLAELGADRPRELRDRAVLTLAFAACLTAEEARNLRLKDVRTAPQGLLVHPPGRAQPAGVPRARVQARCPVTHWAAWRQALEQRGAKDDDTAFPQIQEQSISQKRLDGIGPAWLVTSRCEQAGLHGDFGFTSLRIGFMRTAARAGIPEQLILQQAGLRRLNSVALHVRREQLLTRNAAGMVGL